MMKTRFNRRDFLAVSTVAGIGLAGGNLLAADASKPGLHKAVLGNPTDATLRSLKATGFNGIESTNWAATPQQAETARAAAEALGLRIHSVLFGWADFNRGEAAMARGIAQMEAALRASRAYGGNTVLFVPCKIGGMPIPAPWEFDIRFDEKTTHLKQVVRGDNTKYRQYIDAHNQAIDASREGVRKLIPAAERLGIVIALENVWNNLLVEPVLHANFVASFDSPWVRAYFDIGNHVKYAPPQQWIHTLGKLIAKCHVKDFKLNPNGHDGSFCEMRDGSINWPAVRQALEAIGYHGWLSIEDSHLPLPEQSRRLDLIIAGK
jgi:hexulose-6-phosphate isomerase